MLHAYDCRNVVQIYKEYDFEMPCLQFALRNDENVFFGSSSLSKDDISLIHWLA